MGTVRAATLDDAIVAHGGTAEVVRNRYLALSSAQQAAVIAFLETLVGPDSP